MLSLSNLFGSRSAAPPLEELLHALRKEALRLRDAGDHEGARYYFQCGKSAIARSVDAAERTEALRGLAAIARELQPGPALGALAQDASAPTSRA